MGKYIKQSFSFHTMIKAYKEWKPNVELDFKPRRFIILMKKRFLKELSVRILR